jgi:hypothetical protein
MLVQVVGVALGWHGARAPARMQSAFCSPRFLCFGLLQVSMIVSGVPPRMLTLPRGCFFKLHGN